MAGSQNVFDVPDVEVPLESLLTSVLDEADSAQPRLQQTLNCLERFDARECRGPIHDPPCVAASDIRRRPDTVIIMQFIIVILLNSDSPIR